MAHREKSNKLEMFSTTHRQKNNKRMTNSPKKLLVDNKSRSIKKTSKTPAQDRLRRLAEQIKDSTNNNVNQQLNANHTISVNQPLNFKRKIESPLVPTRPVKRLKTAETLNPKSISGGFVANTKIPNIFPLKSPAQNRLRLLQQKLKPSTNVEIIEPKEETESFKNEDANDVLKVIRQGFGISDVENIQQDNQVSTDMKNIVGTEEPNKGTQCPLGDNQVTHIVPDTNVFLHSLVCIENHILKDAKRYIIVPLVVLEELDRLKREDKQIAFYARKAIDFLYKQLKPKLQRFRGQKVTDDQQKNVTIKVDDDRVLNCCLQLKQRDQNVILLTNDKNLINKAGSYDIVALTIEDYENNHGILNINPLQS